MLETVLARLGLPLLIEIVSGALSKIDNPLAQNASKALNETQKAIAAGQISPEAAAEANRHMERMTELAQKERGEALAQVNESLRAEVVSDDSYVRRMRPTFGYLMAVTWTAQMLALAYIIVFDTKNASVVLDAVESLSAIWAVALSVLGLYVYKRSDEKRPVITVSEAVMDAVEAPPLPPRKPAAPGGRFNN